MILMAKKNESVSTEKQIWGKLHDTTLISNPHERNGYTLLLAEAN